MGTTKKIPNKIGIYAGSFDPIHVGHIDVLLKAAPLFDEIILLVSDNPDKKHHLETQCRVSLAEITLRGNDDLRKKVKVTSTDMPTAKYALNVMLGLHKSYTTKKRNLNQVALIRGLRNPDDFKYEQTMADYNTKLCQIYSNTYNTVVNVPIPKLNTIYVQSSPEYIGISSSAIRQIVKITDKQEFKQMYNSMECYTSYDWFNYVWRWYNV